MTLMVLYIIFYIFYYFLKNNITIIILFFLLSSSFARGFITPTTHLSGPQRHPQPLHTPLPCPSCFLHTTPLLSTQYATGRDTGTATEDMDRQKARGHFRRRLWCACRLCAGTGERWRRSSHSAQELFRKPGRLPARQHKSILHLQDGSCQWRRLSVFLYIAYDLKQRVE